MQAHLRLESQGRGVLEGSSSVQELPLKLQGPAERDEAVLISSDSDEAQRSSVCHESRSGARFLWAAGMASVGGIHSRAPPRVFQRSAVAEKQDAASSASTRVLRK